MHARTTCTIALPLGYSPKYFGSSDQNKGEVAETLREVLGDFHSISFQILQLSENHFSVRIIREKTPEARDRVMDIDEKVAGPLKSTHRLIYGQKVTIQRQEGNKVYIKFEPN